MKHKIAMLLSVGIVAAATVSAVHTHRAYMHQLAIQNAISAGQQARQAAAQKVQAEAQAAKLHDTLDRLQKACSDGLDAYRQLTAAQQKHVVQPSCLIQ